jgi:hypothetical protein
MSPPKMMATLSAYLWDLRSMCEQQVRALTDAQRQLDIYRDEHDPAACEAAMKALQTDLERVAQFNIKVRQAVQDATGHARTLTKA